MKGKPFEMRHVREVLRLLAGGASQREVGESLNIAHSTVGESRRISVFGVDKAREESVFARARTAAH
jgi:FixJ family two-component response regulator